MNNTNSYIRLLNKSKEKNNRLYHNLNIPSDICENLKLESGDKMLIRVQNDLIMIKKVDV